MSLKVTGTIQVRRDTAANWTTADPILSSAEWALETDTRKLKIGDGATAWTSLPYIIDGLAVDTFIALLDTPANYTGSALDVVQVNLTEDGLQFITLATVAFTGDYNDLSNLPTIPTTTAADIAGFYPGVPAASVLFTRIPIATQTTFPASFTGSYGSASVAATASTDFDIQNNGVSVGTMNFAAAATTATFSGAGSVFDPGEVLSVVAPATPDATLANVGFNLHGTRSI